jgi:hypothetical protein
MSTPPRFVATLYSMIIVLLLLFIASMCHATGG